MHFWVEKEGRSLLLIDMVIEKVLYLLCPLLPGSIAAIFCLLIIVLVLTDPLEVFKYTWVFLFFLFTFVLWLFAGCFLFGTFTADLFRIDVTKNNVVLERRYGGLLWKHKRVSFPLHGLVGAVSRVQQWETLVKERKIPATHLKENTPQDFTLGLVLSTGQLINISTADTPMWFGGDGRKEFHVTEDAAAERINAFLAKARPNQPEIKRYIPPPKAVVAADSDDEGEVEEDEFMREVKMEARARRLADEARIEEIRAETREALARVNSGGPSATTGAFTFQDKRRYSLDVPDAFQNKRRYSLDPAGSGNQLGQKLLGGSSPERGSGPVSKAVELDPRLARYRMSFDGPRRQNDRRSLDIDRTKDLFAQGGKLDPRLERYRKKGGGKKGKRSKPVELPEIREYEDPVSD